MRIARKHTPRSRVGFCCGCIQIKPCLERHHVVPQRYEQDHDESELVMLCHDCHLQLHTDWIDPMGRQEREVFIEATQQFLWEKRNADYRRPTRGLW